jgi:hypothetical protein
VTRLDRVDLTDTAAQTRDSDPNVRYSTAQLGVNPTKDANKRAAVFIVAAHIHGGQGGVAGRSGIAHVFRLHPF